MGRRQIMRTWRAGAVVGAVFFAWACGYAQTSPVEVQSPPVEAQSPQREVKKDVPYVPTPQEVVDEMLRIAKVGKDDVVYDLGCGDGRLVITAVRKFGARRGVGVDIDPQRISESRENARAAGVEDRVEFREQDLFETEIKEATVVTLYLLPDINLRLRPRLLSELKPGTRIVSHAFDMGDWKPERVENVEGRSIYFWTVPAKGANGR
jgi:SAM-dependent methyltransferase